MKRTNNIKGNKQTPLIKNPNTYGLNSPTERSNPAYCVKQKQQTTNKQKETKHFIQVFFC